MKKENKSFIRQINTSKYFDVDELPKVTTAKNVQFLGLTIHKTKGGNIKDSDYDKFLSACKEVIESDIFEGILSMIEFDLSPIDRTTEETCKPDGTRSILCSKYNENNKYVNKKDIEERAALVFYFKTPLSKTELIERFGDKFTEEAETPKRW